MTDTFSAVDRNRITATATQTGEDTSLAGNVGVLWSPLDGIKIGAQFRKGPSFEFTQVDDVPLNNFHLERNGRFKVPDVIGVGVEWRLNEKLRLLADYDRVQYSQLKEDFINMQAVSSGRSDQLHIDDGNELHGGFEYLLLNLPKPLAIRGGIWSIPITRFATSRRRRTTPSIRCSRLCCPAARISSTTRLAPASCSPIA